MNVLSSEIRVTDDSLQRLDALTDISQRLLERARAAGATQAEVSCSEERGLDVNVRLGDVETVESTRDRGIAVTVYFGKRKGSASTADLQESSLNPPWRRPARSPASPRTTWPPAWPTRS